MRRQYAALIVLFLALVTYNAVATHRIARANADLARLEDRRFWAEGLVHEYNMVTQQLAARQAKVALMEQVDARIDLAAVLAEISYIIGDRVLLSRLEFTSEPLAAAEKTSERDKTAVRSASPSRATAKTASLGRVRFRVALAGIAVDSAEVGALVRRFEESPYFQLVHPLYRDNTIQIGTGESSGSRTSENEARRVETRSISVTEFEITCYLANYEERDT
ncbi:MAG TPA: hypothetical protein PLU87_00530 [Sedimentisphaerales bacterium]|nr:hypothetical protein [Sedimentisphaerales bacterium]HRS09641.1 hypothetical protein [Sedimentisphaerales bacterium]HRV46322.1 hypothetical protein [Sedimentisphaerales bacterium]